MFVNNAVDKLGEHTMCLNLKFNRILKQEVHNVIYTLWPQQYKTQNIYA